MHLSENCFLKLKQDFFIIFPNATKVKQPKKTLNVPPRYMSFIVRGDIILVATFEKGTPCRYSR